MYLKLAILVICHTYLVYGQSRKCDQTPIDANVRTPSDNKRNPFTLSIKTQDKEDNSNFGKFALDQTYVLILKSNDRTRPFKEFMITAEDPDVDENTVPLEHNRVDVGTLKTLDEDNKSTTKHSERCFSTVENEDKSEKLEVELHWVSPKNSKNDQKIRFRAMAAENSDVWYTGDALTVTLVRDSNKPLDHPPYKPVRICNLCSEARYQVTFKGMWSRATHSLHYPSKPDDNMYSEMVGASHDFNFVLWEPGVKANGALQDVAEKADTVAMERFIIEHMSATEGTRTLIRGKKHQHPEMSEPSVALFRVDRIHHLFSLVVAMKPSPDWFLGTNKFELCTPYGWLDYSEIPLYPWDAGTMDGISYESPPVVTLPSQNVDRVALGSFNKDSPFYQMNLNDIKPFAKLEVRRLDVYSIAGGCNDEAEGQGAENNKESEEDNEDWNDGEEANAEPLRVKSSNGNIKPLAKSCAKDWSDWTACIPDDGVCGLGVQTRSRLVESTDYYETVSNTNDIQVKAHGRCRKEEDLQPCFINC